MNFLLVLINLWMNVLHVRWIVTMACRYIKILDCFFFYKFFTEIIFVSFQKYEAAYQPCLVLLGLDRSVKIFNCARSMCIFRHLVKRLDNAVLGCFEQNYDKTVHIHVLILRLFPFVKQPMILFVKHVILDFIVMWVIRLDAYLARLVNGMKNHVPKLLIPFVHVI